MAPFTRLKVRSLTLCAALLGLSVSAEAFDREPHILIMPGHTSSVEWDDSARAYIPTCQYKSLNGARPRRGEACDGSPRLAISVEDLRDLKYITSTQDKNELVQRVYERFDNILFVTAPDLQFDYGDSPERFEAGPISVRHPRVPPSDYDFLASTAKERLKRSQNGLWGNEYAAGTIAKPYANYSEFGGDPLYQERTILPEYSLVFLPSNPTRMTLVHELLHFLIHRARESAIVDASALKQLNINRGKLRETAKWVEDVPSAIRRFGEAHVAELEALHGQYAVETTDMGYAEELEISYFNSRFGAELYHSEASRRSEEVSFWGHAERYYDRIRTLDRYSHQSIVSGDLLLVYANNNDPLPPRTSTIINPLFDILPIPTFRALWAAIQTMSTAYPRHLLGSEYQVNRSNPRTLMDHFVLNVGPRP